jgi:hypothetical protein
MTVPDPCELVNLSDSGPRSGTQSSNDSKAQRNIFSYPRLRTMQMQATGIICTAIPAHRTLGGKAAFRSQASSSPSVSASRSYCRMLGI